MHCDVVIEAVTENEAIKTGIFETLAGVLRDEAILASNTSTIPISRMARSWVHPQRFAGMHFFHPAQFCGRGRRATDRHLYRRAESRAGCGRAARDAVDRALRVAVHVHRNRSGRASVAAGMAARGAAR